MGSTPAYNKPTASGGSSAPAPSYGGSTSVYMGSPAYSSGGGGGSSNQSVYMGGK